MRPIKLKNLKSRRFIAILIAIVLTFSMLAYMQFTMLAPKPVDVMADLNLLGFQLKGPIDVESAIANSFMVIGDNLTITIPCEDSKVKSLQVIQGENSSYIFNQVVYNASGNLNIEATNIMSFQYEFRNENGTALLSLYNSNLSAFLIGGSSYPQTPVVLNNDLPTDNTFARISAGDSFSLFISFGSRDGQLTVSGDGSFQRHITKGSIGLLLDVSTPKHRSYTSLIDGNYSQIYAENWKTIKMLLPLYPDNISNVTAFSPKGNIAFSNKQTEAVGSQDLNFNNFRGTVYITPTTDPLFFRLLLNGHSDSINVDNPDGQTNIAEKNLVDVLFLIPISIFTLSAFLVLWGLKARPEYYIILPMIFFLGSLAWSVKTDQAVWVQSLFGFAPFFVSTLIYLIGAKKGKETPSE